MKVIVLINCNMSDEYEFMQVLKGLNIPVVHCNGAYQFIVQVEAKGYTEMRSAVEKIRKLKEIRSTLTLTVTSTWKDFDE